MNPETVDPELLENLELLLQLDVLEQEDDWDAIESMDLYTANEDSNES